MVEKSNYRDSKMRNTIFEEYFITKKWHMQSTIIFHIDWKLKQITSLESLVEFTWIEIKNAWEKIELIRSSDEPIQSLEDEKLIKDEILIKTYSLDVNGSKEANFNIKKGNILIKAQNG